MTFNIKILLAVFLSIIFFSVVSTPAASAASSNPLDKACNANDETRNSPLCQQALNQKTEDPVAGPNGIINKAANIIALVASIGAVIMIIIGAFEFVTAGGTQVGQRSGDPNKVKQARARIVSALIGLIVVALAWAIVRLITDKVLR